MKKLLLLLSVLLGAVALRAADAPAINPRDELVTRVNSCDAILEELAPTIPKNILQGAHAIIVVNQFKAGFIFGVKGGYAVILVKRNGQWSVPALLNATEASLGLQLGANAVESVLIINDDVTPRLLFNRRFNVGVDAKAVAGPKVAEKEKENRPILNVPVLVYSKSKGLYAGATVKAGQLTANDEANYRLYNTTYTLPELLYSDWVKAPTDLQSITNRVTQLTR